MWAYNYVVDRVLTCESSEDIKLLSPCFSGDYSVLSRCRAKITTCFRGTIILLRLVDQCYEQGLCLYAVLSNRMFARDVE